MPSHVMKRPGTHANSRLLPWLAVAAITCLCHGCGTVHSGITPENRMTRVTREAHGDTLVVFDIDNTLIEPESQLGSDQWFYHLVDVGMRRGMSSTQSNRWADGTFNDMQSRIRIRSVDPETPEVLARLRRDGIRYFALTARSSGIHETTRRQLEKTGLSMTAGGFNPGAASKPGMIGKGSLYDHGVFYIGETGPSKGEALMRILQLSGCRPERIVFIDDKEKHARSVHESLTRAGIPHLCLRFSKCDAKVASLGRALVTDPSLRDDRFN